MPEDKKTADIVVSKKLVDLDPLVTSDQQGTDIFESSDEAGVSPSRKETRAQMQYWMQKNLTTSPQLVYLSSTGDDTTANGSVLNPFLTYDNAIAFALTLSPSAANPVVLIVEGIFNNAGFNIYPFINIIGLGYSLSQFNCSGTVNQDSSWDSTTLPQIKISNVQINTPQVDFTFTVSQAAVLDLDVDWGTTSDIIINGSATGGNIENILFFSPATSAALPEYEINSVNSKFVGVNAATILIVNANPVSVTTELNSVGSVSAVFNRTSSSGDSYLSIFNSPLIGAIDIQDSQSHLVIDASSYTIAPAFAGSATQAANQVLLSLADGSNANANFTPTNYTSVAGSNYSANSVTANLAGIDAALAGGGGNVNVTDDNSTNAPMNLTWVAGNSGSQSVFTSSGVLQFNPGGTSSPGVPSLTLINSGFVYLAVESTTSGGEAGYIVERADDSSYGQVHFQTANSDHWTIGLRGGDSDFHIYNIDEGAENFRIANSNGQVFIGNLTPNQLVGTDSSRGLITVPSASGIYSPTLVASANIGTLTNLKAAYPVVFTTSGNVGTASVRFTGVPSAAVNVLVQVDCPVTCNFAAPNQAGLVMGQAIHNPGVDNGDIVEVQSVNGTSTIKILAQIPAGGVGQTYTFDVTFWFQIQ